MITSNGRNLWDVTIGDGKMFWKGSKRCGCVVSSKSLIGTNRCLLKIERFHQPRNEYAPFVDVNASAHGSDG